MISRMSFGVGVVGITTGLMTMTYKAMALHEKHMHDPDYIVSHPQFHKQRK